MDDVIEVLFDKLVYSCYFEKQRAHEQFIGEHFLGFQICGETHTQYAGGSKEMSANMVVLAKRNQLIRTTKYPSKEGEYQFVSIILDQAALKQYALEHKIVIDKPCTDAKVIFFEPDIFFKSFFLSLIPYIDKAKKATPKLADLKIREAIELLLQSNPDFKYLLFDFTEPYKIDLEEFMHQNYMFNVPIASFAKLTARSLSAFKRDFEKIFKTSPRQWLRNRRLDEAYYLIKHKKKKPTDIYLELGFENLSHFYSSFKHKFGMTTSEI
ncbi:AraC family transcriptional regulator [Olivibacter sp. CPCC 100613]|uniref:helix-turn-helix domain-containing protein n=1 Tax=Olivibacter sp. CPCC 100613 TaxID=3079931 RepID=UPI002FFA593D